MAAEHKLPALTTTRGPATAHDWAQFLKPIAAAVRNPPTETDFKARVAAIAHALPDVPAIWLTQAWRQREAMRAWQFWPAVADVAEWLAPYQREERESAERHTRIAAPAPEAPRLRSTAEILAVKQAAREVMAAAQVPAGQDRGPPPKPLPLSEGALLAHLTVLAEGGNTVAAYRAETIRKRLAQQEMAT